MRGFLVPVRLNDAWMAGGLQQSTQVFMVTSMKTMIPKTNEHWCERYDARVFNWGCRFYVDEDWAAHSRWYGTRTRCDFAWRDSPPPGMMPLPANRGKIPPPLPQAHQQKTGFHQGHGQMVLLGWSWGGSSDSRPGFHSSRTWSDHQWWDKSGSSSGFGGKGYGASSEPQYGRERVAAWASSWVWYFTSERSWYTCTP